MSFEAKYPGRCAAESCNYGDARIEVGDEIEYVDDELMHTTCAARGRRGEPTAMPAVLAVTPRGMPVMRLECDRCGLAACDIPDGFAPETCFEREGDQCLCAGCHANYGFRGEIEAY